MVKFREIWVEDFGDGVLGSGSLGLGFGVKGGEIKGWRFFR